MNEVLHAAGRGAVGAMAMTGMRAVTIGLGIVDQTPPQAILKQKARGLMALAPRKKRRAALELARWTYGVAGDAAFGLLPGFELGLAPMLGLSQAKKPRPVDRLGLAADHLLYGLVLNQGRRRPQESSA